MDGSRRYASMQTIRSRSRQQGALMVVALVFLLIVSMLAMSTVDIVNQVGGQPANFLDIGGGANADVMAGALEVINNDPEVKSIFINIFGGITRGEEVANGIVQALGRVTIESPIVIRLDGTNAEEGRAILKEHESERLQSQPTMLDAARTAVELAGGR